MAARTHYEVLGVSGDANPDLVREAYRERARVSHPDRQAGSPSLDSADEMAAINEAYRVLSDPGRRAMYDASLRGTGSAVPASPRGPASSRFDGDWVGSPGALHPSHVGPARVPWRMLLFCGALAVIAIVAIAQFTKPAGPPVPDGILRIGDCISIESNNDAREVPCLRDGESVDLVVSAFIPFDATCPGRTEPHRDRQGMGIACVLRPD